CDAFHAMTSRRSYAGAVSTEDAIEELRRCAGAQFDPLVVEALCVELGQMPVLPPREGPPTSPVEFKTSRSVSDR
ncbi:MAG: metal-dependent phosphohydrolase, partial [Actinomycetota bacterium]|nr:metal-dependent phosphohydrolase [Actinomycetota bacterium]